MDESREREMDRERYTDVQIKRESAGIERERCTDFQVDTCID